MIGITVKFAIQDAKRELKGLERQVNKAAAAALNRAADSTAVAGSREISAATKIKQRDVKSRIKVRGANPGKLIADVEAYPYSPNLKAFRPTQNKKGVAATAWERRKTYKGAFINPKTGSVVARTGKARWPLKGLRGPSVPKTFLTQRVVDVMTRKATEVFADRFPKEIARRTR